jgi:hypothetical protein
VFYSIFTDVLYATNQTKLDLISICFDEVILAT